MPGMHAEEVYAKHIKSLSASERLHLVALIAEDLSTEETTDVGTTPRTLSAIRGMGAEIWKGVDAQTYVDKLRDEWNRDP